MIITQQTTYGFASVLLWAFVFGVLLSCFYMASLLCPAIVSSSGCIKNGYKSFCNRVKCYKCSRYYLALSDALIFIAASCLVCVLSFIFNSGLFRPVFALSMFVGFFLGKDWLSKAIFIPITATSFALLKIIFGVLLPFVALARIIGRVLQRILVNVIRTRKIALMKKYTKEKFDRLGSLAESGLLDHNYKDWIK